ncbi:unnamed protein product [Cyprideis torosa]|uniref:Uncharacterized protein n=1 Tax=Cyprideis torosa TaxID=163714 RepID=A0A7R8ZP81_9CRUS|nr:unnamed protein product [Cyprideis torosa]CAG0893339.1 unnamed protein product [Cyprideis torosa]
MGEGDRFLTKAAIGASPVAWSTHDLPKQGIIKSSFSDNLQYIGDRCSESQNWIRSLEKAAVRFPELCSPNEDRVIPVQDIRIPDRLISCWNCLLALSVPHKIGSVTYNIQRQFQRKKPTDFAQTIQKFLSVTEPVRQWGEFVLGCRKRDTGEPFLQGDQQSGALLVSKLFKVIEQSRNVYAKGEQDFAWVPTPWHWLPQIFYPMCKDFLKHQQTDSQGLNHVLYEFNMPTVVENKWMRFRREEVDLGGRKAYEKLLLFYRCQPFKLGHVVDADERKILTEIFLRKMRKLLRAIREADPAYEKMLEDVQDTLDKGLVPPVLPHLDSNRTTYRVAEVQFEATASEKMVKKPEEVSKAINHFLSEVDSNPKKAIEVPKYSAVKRNGKVLSRALLRKSRVNPGRNILILLQQKLLKSKLNGSGHEDKLRKERKLRREALHSSTNPTMKRVSQRDLDSSDASTSRSFLEIPIGSSDYPPRADADSRESLAKLHPYDENSQRRVTNDKELVHSLEDEIDVIESRKFDYARPFYKKSAFFVPKDKGNQGDCSKKLADATSFLDELLFHSGVPTGSPKSEKVLYQRKDLFPLHVKRQNSETADDAADSAQDEPSLTEDPELLGQEAGTIASSSKAIDAIKSTNVSLHEVEEIIRKNESLDVHKLLPPGLANVGNPMVIEKLLEKDTLIHPTTPIPSTTGCEPILRNNAPHFKAYERRKRPLEKRDDDKFNYDRRERPLKKREDTFGFKWSNVQLPAIKYDCSYSTDDRLRRQRFLDYLMKLNLVDDPDKDLPSLQDWEVNAPSMAAYKRGFNGKSHSTFTDLIFNPSETKKINTHLGPHDFICNPLPTVDETLTPLSTEPTPDFRFEKRHEDSVDIQDTIDELQVEEVLNKSLPGFSTTAVASRPQKQNLNSRSEFSLELSPLEQRPSTDFLDAEDPGLSTMRYPHSQKAMSAAKVKGDTTPTTRVVATSPRILTTKTLTGTPEASFSATVSRMPVAVKSTSLQLSANTSTRLFPSTTQSVRTTVMPKVALHFMRKSTLFEEYIHTSSGMNATKPQYMSTSAEGITNDGAIHVGTTSTINYNISRPKIQPLHFQEPSPTFREIIARSNLSEDTLRAIERVRTVENIINRINDVKAWQMTGIVLGFIVGIFVLASLFIVHYLWVSHFQVTNKMKENSSLSGTKTSTSSKTKTSTSHFRFR